LKRGITSRNSRNHTRQFNIKNYATGAVIVVLEMIW